MINILADKSLPQIDTLFSAPFRLTTYRREEELPSLLPHQDVLICRATLKVTPHLLANSHLQYIATASSGTDHIDQQHLRSQGIHLLDAKGANATAVADYVIATVACLIRQQLLPGYKAGVVGFGEVGRKVFERLQHLGFDVIYYDPWLKSSEKTYQKSSLTDLLQCQLITLHANWHQMAPFPSHRLINQEMLCQMLPHTVLINTSRGDIVDEAALLKASQPITYCTDVYAHEPHINPELIQFATLCTPHIAGHSIESKLRTVSVIQTKLYERFGIPKPLLQPSSRIPLTPDTDWQTCVLNLYDPSDETRQMKISQNIAQTFSTLRQSHQFRHDFNCYDMSYLSDRLQKILGRK